MRQDGAEGLASSEGPRECDPVSQKGSFIGHKVKGAGVW